MIIKLCGISDVARDGHTRRFLNMQYTRLCLRCQRGARPSAVVKPQKRQKTLLCSRQSGSCHLSLLLLLIAGSEHVGSNVTSGSH